MEFRVLGPVRALDLGRELVVPAGRVRVMLAVLLLRANHVVTVEELVDHLWAAAPPDHPRGAIQTYVGRLRKILGEGVVQTRPQGYLIEIDPETLDLTVFRRLVNEAARTPDPREQAGLLEKALTLWTDQPLTDVSAETLAREAVPRLAEERLHAVEQWVDARLQLGQHAELVPELISLTTEHPLRERLRTRLMLALYRCGRRADALEAYRTVSRLLAEELGIDPGDELRQLHQAMLTDDPALNLPSRKPDQHPTVPRQLPPDVRGFIGRTSDLKHLDALLTDDDRGPVVITAIAGTAGVGKTALAAHWARQVAERFPDGQLWVNLRGYDPERPMPPGHALTMVLRSLGVPGTNIPVELDAQVGLYRSLLESRRMLLVLDNAGSAEQVRPLLAGAPGCLVLITSRDELSGLVARDGAIRLTLGLLSHQESVALLRRLLGAGATDLDALSDLANLCARLPLALRIAADRVDSSNRPLQTVVAELAAEHRLDTFAAGNDPHTAARAVFSWSYRALPEPAARLFRRLGLIPGADWDTHAAAAVVDSSLAQARRLLDVLVAAHLVEESKGRYQMHDLLRAYATEQALIEDDCRAALTRLLDYYLGTAAAAMDVAFAHEKHRRPPVPTPNTPIPDLPDADHGSAWLDDERPNLAAATAHAAGNGWPTHAVQLAATLYRYLLTGAHHSHALAIHRNALEAAATLQDSAAQATALHNLGAVNRMLGHYDQAFEHYAQAIAITRQSGDRGGEAAMLNALGIVEVCWGRYDEALQDLQRAVALYRELGDRTGEAHTLNNLGIVYKNRGHFDSALACLQHTCAIYRELGDRLGEADSLGNLGNVHLGTGRYQQAFEHFSQTLVLARELGDGTREATTLENLGTVHLRLGRHQTAFIHLREALGIVRKISYPRLEVSILNGLGETSRAAVQPTQAVDHHRSALRLAEQLGDRYEQARALDGIAGAERDLGHHGAAGRHWHKALALYTDLNVPRAGQVRAELDSLNQQPAGRR